MDHTSSPQKKKMIHSFIAMSCILGLIIVCLLLLPNFTYSWFAKNETVKGSGMGVNAEDIPFQVEYARCDTQTLTPEEFAEIDPNAPLNFLGSDVWYPGYSVVFQIKITNMGNSPICVDSVGFCAPAAGEEQPRIVDDVSYYLGTQLSVTVLAVNGAAQPAPAEQRLLTVKDGQPAFSDLTIYEDEAQAISLQPSEDLRLTIRLTFVNEAFSQDVYANFAKAQDATECCQRRVFVTYVPT